MKHKLHDSLFDPNRLYSITSLFGFLLSVWVMSKLLSSIFNIKGGSLNIIGFLSNLVKYAAKIISGVFKLLGIVIDEIKQFISTSKNKHY